MQPIVIFDNNNKVIDSQSLTSGEVSSSVFNPSRVHGLSAQVIISNVSSVDFDVFFQSSHDKVNFDDIGWTTQKLSDSVISTTIALTGTELKQLLPFPNMRLTVRRTAGSATVNAYLYGVIDSYYYFQRG